MVGGQRRLGCSHSQAHTSKFGWRATQLDRSLCPCLSNFRPSHFHKHHPTLTRARKTTPATGFSQLERFDIRCARSGAPFPFLHRTIFPLSLLLLYPVVTSTLELTNAQLRTTSIPSNQHTHTRIPASALTAAIRLWYCPPVCLPFLSFCRFDEAA